MTIDSIETMVRGIINDSLAPFRWSSEKLQGYLGKALRRLNTLARSTRYVGGSLLDGTPLPASKTEALQLDDRYEEALAYYVAHLCYLLDDPDTANAELANTYLAKAERMMV